MAGSPTIAGGETRTISLFHIHTGENLTVTYMKDGHYVPSAMKQINYLLRDWRRNETVTIDPRTIDLVWELHEDMGSHETIHIVCGYRSPRTNAFLHRIGRNVATKSQHMVGHAIDFYFPDIPTVKLRDSALVRQVGGVGFYRSAGGPTGFLHVDSGHVRHWGPVISNVQMAQIMRENIKTIGKRMRGNHTAAADSQVAANGGGGLLGALANLTSKKTPEALAVETAYTGNEEDMADLSADAATPADKTAAATGVNNDQMASLGDLAKNSAKAPAAQVADATPPEPVVAEPMVKQGFPVPKPRLKPVEIMLMAAANMKTDPKMIRISAASAPPPSQSGNDKPSPVADSLSTLIDQTAMDDPASDSQTPNAKGKGNFAAELRSGTAGEVPLIKPLMASAGGSDINWWPQMMLSGEAAIRRDGAPTMIGAADDSSLPVAANLSAQANAAFSGQQAADGKGDLLVVNREGKGSLELGTMKHVVKLDKVGQLVTP